MAVMNIYAGSSAGRLTKLPSPTELKTSFEQIWSENTGRAQSGVNKAKMIGDVVATKMTYSVKWGVLTYDELQTIRNNLTTGFFYFAIGTSTPSTAYKFYRGNIGYNIIQAGANVYYKDVTVDIIEQ